MTKLLYLEDTYLFESEASFLELREHEKGKAVILDQTIFYPQGGGQPADQGTINADNAVFQVSDVRLDPDGTVWHFGEFESGEFQAGEQVNLKIDQERRILNAKLHSAGHLLDCAIEKVGVEGLKPTKGFHFPDGPYVEYEGVVENSEDILPQLEECINQLIAEDLSLEIRNLSFEEAQNEGVDAPPGKSARIVGFSGFEPCGCGGTHVKNASEIGKVIVRKIKSKKGVTKISYAIE